MGKTKAAAPAPFSAGEVCHPGLKREENQDRVAHGASPFGEIYIISDGVGGYHGGAEASEIVASGMLLHLNAIPAVKSPEEALTEAVRRANAEVFAAAQSGDASRRRMSATLVAVLLVRQGGGYDAVIGNVGDSRAYLVRGGKLIQLSADHTAVQGMVEAGVLTTEQARDHPHASVLTRTMGQGPEVSMSLKRVSLQQRDHLLLCSDGLHGYVGAQAIQATVSQASSPEAGARKLLDLALAAGAPDNVSVELIRINVGAPVEAKPSRWTRRPALLASYAAIAILICCAGAVGLYRHTQSQPIQPGYAPERPITSNSPRMPDPTAADPNATANNTSLPAEGENKKRSEAKAEARLTIGWMASSVKADHEDLSRLRTKLQQITEITGPRKTACMVVEPERPTAYYANLEMSKRPEIEGSDLPNLYTAVQIKREIRSACGTYDVLLLPSKASGTARATIAIDTGKAAIKRLRHPLRD